MECLCGYQFELDRSRRRRAYDSYAVIRDRDYQAFLRSEMRVLKARGELAKLAALGRSAKHVGSLLECPQCARLLLLRPGEDEPVIYVPDPKRRRKAQPPRPPSLPPPKRRRSR